MNSKKILFLVCNGAEARIVNLIQHAFENQVTVRIISTSEISREKSDQAPEEALSKFGLHFKRLIDYQTHDVTKILRQEMPDVLVLGSDQEFLSQAFVYAANRLNIPTLLLRLGISTNVVNVPGRAVNSSTQRLAHNSMNILIKYSYKLSTMIGSAYNPLKVLRELTKDIWRAFLVYDASGTFGCRAIAIAGPWEKTVLMERGINPKKIFLTGNPEFSVLPLSQNYVVGDLRQSLGIKSEEKVILLLTSAMVEHGFWTEEMRASFVKGVINSLNPILKKDFRLIIKIHPVENLDVYRKILGSENKRVLLYKDLKLTDAILVSDVVMAGYSTTVLQACAFRKPVIILNIFGSPEYLPYVEMGLAIGVYDIDKLKETVEKIAIDMPTREKLLSNIDLFLSNNEHNLDGRAACRIADLILALST
jgi:hypothetical protein